MYSEQSKSKSAIVSGRVASSVEAFDFWLGKTVEMVSAGLVVVEVAILFIGVVSRYGFHSPLTWSDELASILFLWLAMFGSVVAIRKSSHMRMTLFVNTSSEKTRGLLESLGIVASITFLMLMLIPSVMFASVEAAMSMPGLGISSLWRAAAMPVGVALMVITGANRLLLSTSIRDSMVAVSIVGAVAALIFVFRNQLIAIDNLNLIVFFVALLGACVFAGVPIAFAFGLSTFSYLVATTNTPLDIVIGRMSEGMSHLILLAVPLFVLLGLLFESTGMAKRLVLFLASLFGGLRGGLSYVLVGAMYLVSGISGSKAADMAAIAPALFPEMRKRGCKPGDLVALLSATGAQTETIPPSLVLITIGSVTGVSISALFAGGLLPAAVVGALICAVIWFHSRSEAKVEGSEFNYSQVSKAFLVAIPALALPFLIRAAVVEGIATATEVSTLGIVYTLIVGVVLYKELNWRHMKPMLVDTALLSGAILLIIGCATGMAWGLTQSGFSNDLADFASRLPGGKSTFMAASIIGFVLLGSVLEGIPAIVLFGPLMFPIAQNLGINEVQYAMVVVLAMGVGLFAPPFGVGYYAACAVSRVDPSEGFRPLIPYMIVLVIGVVIVAAIPSISTCFL